MVVVFITITCLCLGTANGTERLSLARNRAALNSKFLRHNYEAEFVEVFYQSALPQVSDGDFHLPRDIDVADHHHGEEFGSSDFLFEGSGTFELDGSHEETEEHGSGTSPSIMENDEINYSGSGNDYVTREEENDLSHYGEGVNDPSYRFVFPDHVDKVVHSEEVLVDHNGVPSICKEFMNEVLILIILYRLQKM